MKKQTNGILFFSLLFLSISQLNAQSIQPVVQKKYTSFELNEVKLHDEEFKSRQLHDFNYIRTLDPDRYLAPFRRNAGVVTDSKGNPVDNKKHYGGWEYLGSSTFGHYLSAISMMYKVTGEKSLLDKINYMIEELDYIQRNPTYPNENLKQGVLVAFDRNNQDQIQEPNFLRTYDELRAGNVNLTSAPNKRTATVATPFYKNFYWLSGGLSWYTNHKIYAGIRDAYRYTGNPKAKKVFLFFCDWACWVTENLSEKAFASMLYSEHGAINEMLVEAYAWSGDKKYLDCALRFNEREMIMPCVEGNRSKIAEAISNTHANAQIPQFFGVLKEYEYTGEESWLKAAENFFRYVTEQQSFVTGGNSEWEQFREPANIDAQVTRRSGETCNTYNMLKIAKGLFEYTADNTCAEYCERALYNHILPSIHTGKLGAFTYFLSLEPGYFKTFSRPYDSHWCCVGTGMENHAKYGEFIYFHTEKDLFVNLYIASELVWKEKGLKIKAETDFPYNETIVYRILECDGKEWAINYRNPDWAKDVTIKVNGKKVMPSDRNGYFEIKRKWKVNDVVELVLPLTLRKEYMPGRPDKFAFFYGPVLLAGKLGKENMPETVFARGENDFTGSRNYDYNRTIPVFQKTKDAKECLSRETGPGIRFRSEHGIELVPFYDVMEERYTVYWEEK